MMIVVIRKVKTAKKNGVYTKSMRIFEPFLTQQIVDKGTLETEPDINLYMATLKLIQKLTQHLYRKTRHLCYLFYGEIGF